MVSVQVYGQADHIKGLKVSSGKEGVHICPGFDTVDVPV